MPLRPLLPLVDRGSAWPALNRVQGINPESRNNFGDRLYRPDSIKASGVPSLFSHPFVVYTKLNAGVGDMFAKFSTLVKGVFLNIVHLRDVTGQLGQLENVARMAKPNLGNFLILEWKGHPIGGTYPDCLVFPGAKFEAGEYGNDVDWNSLTTEVQKAEKQLGSDIVKALFARWVDEIDTEWQKEVRSILSLPPGADLPAGIEPPLWLQQLSVVKNNWTTLVQPPNSALDEFAPVTSYAQVMANGERLVGIPIRSVTKQIFCDKIIRFDNGQMQRMPDLPVKSDYLDMVVSCERANNIYNLILRYWIGPIAWTPQDPQQIIDGDEASILLWPDFKAPGWNINYALLYPSAQFISQQPSIRLINFDGANAVRIAEIREQPGEIAGCMTNESITHVEVLCSGNPAGIFIDNRQNIPPGQGAWGISLDFGTSNTCLSIRDGTNIIPFRFTDLTVDILGMGFYNQNAYWGVPFWFPSFVGDFAVLPSELLFTSPQTIGPQSLNSPIKYFSIPPFVSHIDPQTATTVVANFKWYEPQEFRGHRDALVKSYLKMVLHMALANLRRSRNANQVTVAPTYPLAFDGQRYLNYRNWLQQLFVDLVQETGIGINLEITTVAGTRELIGESYAGSASYSPPAHLAECVVDIGGGSIDIALTRNNETLAVDSIKCGANILIHHLANHLFPPFPIGNNMNVGARERILQTTIRREGVRDVFDRYDSPTRMIAEEVLHRYFAGLFEYLSRLLSAHQLQNNIFLYVIGNGWKLMDGFAAQGGIDAYIASYFNARNIDLQIIQPVNLGMKEALAVGANYIVNTGGAIPPDLNEPVKGPGCAEVAIEWNGNRRVFSPTDPIPTPGLGCTLAHNPRFDTSSFIRSLPFPLPANVTEQQLAARLNQKCLNRNNDMLRITGGGLSLVRSVFGLFLEKIYPEYYL